jgi:hypothetical protein
MYLRDEEEKYPDCLPLRNSKIDCVRLFLLDALSGMLSVLMGVVDPLNEEYEYVRR